MAAPDSPVLLSRRLVLLLALGAGVGVANNYYLQPLLELIGRDLTGSVSALGVVATLAQLGYALGLVLLVPLGDMVDRRRLILVLLGITTVALLGVAAAPSLPVLAGVVLGLGASGVVAQVLLPYAATLADDRSRSSVVGTLLSGLLLGIVAARTIGGLLGGALGWRGTYLLAAGATVGLALMLAKVLPAEAPRPRLRYRALLASVGAMLREEPLLRRRSFYGAMGFGTFSAFWTTVAFLLADSYGFGPGAVGALALLGVAGAGTSLVAGRLEDRGHAVAMTLTGLVGITASAGLLWLGGTHLGALVAGAVLLDVSVQLAHVANQGVAFRLRPAARSRVSTAYMTSVFLGGAAGSLLSALAYSHYGWDGVCLLIAALGLASLTVALPALSLRRPMRLWDEQFPESVA